MAGTLTPWSTSTFEIFDGTVKRGYDIDDKIEDMLVNIRARLDGIIDWTDSSATALNLKTSVVNDIFPVGTVLAYGGATAPNNFLICDGSAISRTTYSALFSKFSTTFGGGDGSSTFNIPDTRGIFIRGAGVNGTLTNANGTAFSATFGSYENDKMQGHVHKQNANETGKFISVSGGGTFNVSTGGGGLHNVGTTYTNAATVADGTNGTPRTGEETNPANLALNHIVKY